MIYFGTENGIYRWYASNPWPVFHGLQHHAIAGLTVSPGGLMAAFDTGGRVWESQTNGINWSEAPLPAEAGRPTTIALGGEPPLIWLATAASQLLHKALDRPGWTPLATPPIIEAARRPGIRMLTHLLGRWFAALDGGCLWRSDDDGQSWIECPGLPSNIFALRGVAGEDLAAATSDTCWFSTDLGRTWERRGQGLDEAPHVRALEIRPDDPNYLLAGAAAGVVVQEPADSPRRRGLGFRLYESKDGGKSWSHVQRGFPDLLEFDPIADIRFDPADPDYAIVALESGECWRTRNGGAWWEPIARQLGLVRAMCAVS